MNRAMACLLALAMPGSLAQAAPVSVPFVGCASDGQIGSQPAPEGQPQTVDVDALVTARLAFYQAKDYDGVLAPRGWHCANLEGSSGWILFVSPQAIKPGDFLPPRGQTVSGPLIQVSFNLGGTSGRFEAARLIARYFPQKRAFVQSVIAEGVEPAAYFPSGPYPKDELMSRDKNFVEYLTPPHSKGLGTASRLKPDREPIYSAAMLPKDDDTDRPSVLTVAIRLPKDMADLAPIILHQAEQRYAGAK